jgi:hypothetical protein
MLFSYYFLLLKFKTGVDSQERVQTLKIGQSAGNQRLIYLIKIHSVGSSETKRRALR